MRVFNEIFAIGIREDRVPAYELFLAPVEDANPSQQARDFLVSLGIPAFLHSTSWRYVADGGLMLTWVTYIPTLAPLPHDLVAAPLAKGADPMHPDPVGVERANVLSHGLRHLAFLLRTDPVFAQSLSYAPDMRSLLAGSTEGLAGLV